GIAKALLLLEGGVVLLVDNDEPGVRELREHGRARADDYPRRAAASPAPCSKPLGVGQSRMHDRELTAETCAQSVHELRGQSDLGDQKQRLTASRKLLGNEAQENFRLAAAG